MPPVSRRTTPNIQEIEKTAMSSVDGTEAEDFNSCSTGIAKFNPNIHSFINACFDNLANSHIASIKANISAYKKECKEIQQENKELLKQVSSLEGQVKVLTRIGWSIIVGSAIVITGMISYYLQNIAPLIP